MVRMRIPIREQLGCLVLLASLIGLAVIAIATWVTNHNFVLSIRATRLTLTASLKSAQVSSNLLLMQYTVRQTANRLAIQSALQRYNDGNDTLQNWARSRDDLTAVFTGDGNSYLTIQAQIYPANSSNFSVLNATADAFLNTKLPYLNANGSPATMGNQDTGFIKELYPKFEVMEVPFNSTTNRAVATFNGRSIDNKSYLVSGPYRVNVNLSLISITMPIINNTSDVETLGWLTAVLDARLITDVVNATEGLDKSGLTLMFAPANSTNKFADGVLYNSPSLNPPANEQVRFLVAPTQRKDMTPRHGIYDNAMDPTPSAFNWTQFPAIREGFTVSTGQTNNAGAMISTNNEQGNNAAIGYAVVNNAAVDWMVAVEQSHAEVWAPIYRLRNVILACVFGTMGALLVLAFPVAHFSSRPIRRLRDATKKSVSPYVMEDDSLGSQPDGTNDAQTEEIARKEGWFGQIKHYRRNQKASRAERKEEERRRQFRIPGKVKDRKHFIHDELTDLTKTFNEMTDELMMQYERLEERVAQRTAELETSKKAAEAANESKTLFIANISHELKTPLNGILGMCAVCMSEDDPVKLRRSLGIIYKSGDLLLNLLTDLLTFR
jgi:osomolarity two-component system sensor histidine kinase SLN1